MALNKKVGYIATKYIDKSCLLPYLFLDSCQSPWATLLPWSLTHTKPVCGLPCMQKSCGCGRMASASRFSEEEFQEACAELQRPRVSGWEIPVVTSVVKVYQRPLKKVR